MLLQVLDSKDYSHSEPFDNLADLTIAQNIKEFIVPRENLQAETDATVASGSTSAAAVKIFALEHENAALTRKLAALKTRLKSIIRDCESGDDQPTKRYVQRG